ncbi:hypothetical protein GCM10009416_07020 [Craurococcus roseus]|uniref:Uncharacterized protein n=1 Tax=Craurococcus roseus TaxID=77585 RepID=A0ABN1EPE6_9PROT
MFEVVDDGCAPDVLVVRGTGGFAGQSATFAGPDARSRAEAYARWMNAGGAFQRRRTDPGFKGGAGHAR